MPAHRLADSRCMSRSVDARPRDVLVIDDDPSIRALLREVLVMEGFDVRTAEDGSAGLSLIDAQRPDCVVLDLMMPGLDGHAVLREIRARDGNGQLPVIMLTAACDDVQTWRAWAGGVDCFLPKPFTPDLLLRWVNHMCAFSCARSSAVETARTYPHHLWPSRDDKTRQVLERACASRDAQGADSTPPQASTQR